MGGCGRKGGRRTGVCYVTVPYGLRKHKCKSKDRYCRGSSTLRVQSHPQFVSSLAQIIQKILHLWHAGSLLEKSLLLWLVISPCFKFEFGDCNLLVIMLKPLHEDNARQPIVKDDVNEETFFYIYMYDWNYDSPKIHVNVFAGLHRERCFGLV